MEKLLIQGILLFLSFVVISAGCGGHYTAMSGTFQSPRYPNKYPNNKECTYTIDTGYPVTITCQTFVMQGTNRRGICKKDYVTITEASLETTFCGLEGPDNYVSSASYVEFTFVSNEKKRKQGFSCTYESNTNGESTTTSSSTTTTTTSSSTTTTTTSSSTTTTTTPANTTPMATLLQDALAKYTSGSCDSRGRNTCNTCSVTYADSEYYTTTSGNYRIVVGNGIPNHAYEIGQDRPNPNNACPHEVYMAVPLNPVKGSTYNEYGMGPVGIATSGGFFYNHLSRPTGDLAVPNEGESFDTCNGHSDPNCRYHYHEVPLCIAGEGGCNMVGYMRDGFPVYTFCRHETENRYLKSCYYQTSGDGTHKDHFTFDQTAYNNGDCDLDKANGYEFSDGRGYAYIFTEEYPFIMAGYYGTQLSSLCYIY